MASNSDLKLKSSAGCVAGRARAFGVCVPDYLDLSCVKNHEEGAKSIATNAQMHTSVPQPHVLWLSEVGMVLSPKKYVLLRANAQEMNSMSLEVDNSEENGLFHGALGDCVFTARQLVLL